MKERWEKFRLWLHGLDPRAKFLFGILFIVLGLLALVTPLTPGSWLVFVGLELLGIRILAWRRVWDWWHGRTDETPPPDAQSRL